MKLKFKLATLAYMAGGFLCTTFAQEKVETLEEIVVTGTGTEHLLKNAPVQTEIISRKTLDSYGGKSIEEILGGLTASFSFEEGDMGSQAQLNGLGNSYILILVDGKRLHGDVGGENDLSQIDPLNIDHIEIVKGAQSALYGSDAMAGVINIITKKHHDEGIYLENTTRYGCYNDIRQHNGVGLTYGKLNSFTNFQLQHNDGWRNTTQEYTEGKVVNDSRKKTSNERTNWQLAERLTYSFNKNFEVYADGSYHKKNIYRPQDGHYASCDVYTYDLMYKNMSASVGSKWKLNKNDLLSADVDWNKHAYFYNYTATTLTDGYDPLGRFTNYFPYFRGQKSLQSDQQRIIANVKGVFNLSKENKLSTGIEYRYDYLKAPMRTEGGTAGDWTGSFYLQDEFNPFAWLNLTGGLRLNENGNFGFRATPKINAMFSVKDFRFRMGWSQGFKTPTTKELYYRYLHVMGSSTYFNMGNTDLKPQTSNYYSVGAEYRGDKFTVSTTVYLNKLDNMITLVNVPVDEIPVDATSAYIGDGSGEVIARKYKNMEDAQTQGADLNITYKICKSLSVGGNYSYLDTKAHEYNASKKKLIEVTIDGMAHHKWNGYVNWNQALTSVYKLGVNLSTRGSSKRYYQNNGDGAPFQLWRLNTTHDFSKKGKLMSYRAEAGVDNLFNYIDKTMHPYHLGTNNPGRTFYIGFSIKFNQGKNIKPTKISNSKTFSDED
ncbi:MAG: TonB-dependent receptor [Paludibacteraceae bacterium]|nr:TonB-dependent receptor [Paludibacteraceae bacterium]